MCIPTFNKLTNPILNHAHPGLCRLFGFSHIGHKNISCPQHAACCSWTMLDTQAASYESKVVALEVGCFDIF